jgi:type IV secretion system protein VirB8
MADNRQPGPQPTKVDPRYFQEASIWESDIARHYRASRRTAWFIAILMSATTLALIGILAMVLPLKTYEPYMVVVDKSSGFVEVKRPMATGALTQDEAVAMFNVVRYIRAREIYDPKAVKENYDLAQLMATGNAARDLTALFSAGNPQSPVRLYGSETVVSVFIKSVTFPNPNTALVRFSTQENGASGSTSHDWVSLLRFKYSRASMPNEWRFDNPLGFQVSDYRRDQEAAFSSNAAAKP